MENEIDLRQYIEVLIKHRWLIIAGAVLATLSAFVVSFLLIVPKYEASAGVLISPTRSRITFDPRFQTVESNSASSYYAALNQQAHRAALVALVKSGAIATQVAERLKGELDEKEQSPAKLLEMVSGTLRQTQERNQQSGSSDFIVISVLSDDPAKAALIANTWAEVYESHVNEVYGKSTESYTSVKKQVITARETYKETQEALIKFIAENHIADLNRLINEKQHIIDSLETARQTAVTTVIDEEVKARSQVIAAYVNAQAQNRLIAFQKEQEGKRAMVSSYMDAQNQGREAVFDRQAEDKLQTLANHYTTKRKMERLLADAKALYAQVREGGADGAATSSLAILMLKAEAFSTSASLPGELQLQLEMASGINVGARAQQADVQTLIGVLQDRIAELENKIEEESAALLAGEDYEFLSSSVPLTDTLSTAIRDQFPELFEVGELTALTLSEAISHDNPLAEAVAQTSEALLQLEELETLPSYTTMAAPLSRAIDELIEEVQSLESEREKEQAEKKELTRARDLAWETYSTLQNKSAELGIATEMMDVEVLFAAPAVEPVKPIESNRLRNVVLAAVVGFMMGVGVAFLIHYLDPEYDSAAAIGALVRRSKKGAD